MHRSRHDNPFARAAGRRALVTFAVALACFVVAPRAFAGSYLDRAALLISQATHEADYLRAHLSDRELAHVVHRVAAARLRAATTMQVPEEVAQAHPHVLLVLQSYERAAKFAADGQTQQFLLYQQKARDEERILRGVLKELGWPLPKDIP